MPTRCSGSMPSAIRPAASASTLSPTCFQVTDSHASPRGKRKASASGDLATRSKNWTATLAGMVSRKAVSMVVGICYLLIRRSVARRRHTAGGAADLGCHLDHLHYRVVAIRAFCPETARRMRLSEHVDAETASPAPPW